MRRGQVGASQATGHHLPSIAIPVRRRLVAFGLRRHFDVTRVVVAVAGDPESSARSGRLHYLLVEEVERIERIGSFRRVHPGGGRAADDDALAVMLVLLQTVLEERNLWVVDVAPELAVDA